MKLEILGSVYRVKKSKKIDDYGYCDIDNKKIVLSSKLSRAEFQHKLTHEILHVITSSMNLPLGDCGKYNGKNKWIETKQQTINHMTLDAIALGISTLRILDHE